MGTVNVDWLILRIAARCAVPLLPFHSAMRWENRTDCESILSAFHSSLLRCTFRRIVLCDGKTSDSVLSVFMFWTESLRFRCMRSRAILLSASARMDSNLAISNLYAIISGVPFGAALSV